jgi:arylsulfatase A-like enzyme
VSIFALSLIELINLWAVSSVSRSPQAQQLIILYGTSLILCVGLSLALVVQWILRLAEWGSAGLSQKTDQDWSSVSALPVAIVSLSVFVGLSLSVYKGSDPINQNYSGYFWLLPSGAISAYIWSLTKRGMQKFDAHFGGPWSPLLSAGLCVLTLLLMYHFVSEPLKQVITAWPLLALILGPVFVFIGLGVSLLTPDFKLFDRLFQRIHWSVLILSIVSLADLSEYMGRYESVKETLLEQSYMSASIIKVIQPFFDEDGDGVAGKLGGVDCDDQNPNVYPGAKEIPLNGIDEDCFGGDYLPPQRKIQTPIHTSKLVAGGTVSRPNIILITVDTLRADHLKFVNPKYPRKTSPFLDSLSTKGLNFKWAFSTGAQTRTSMPAVFIGRYYSEVSRSTGDWAEIYPDNLTLAERLRASGYKTVGVPAHNYFNSSYGLSQGFEEWNFDVVSRFRQDQQGEGKGTSYHITGGAVTDTAIKWLDEQGAQSSTKPFFLWLHYFDPHHIYRDHPNIDFRTRRDQALKPIDLYDEEIRYTDQQIERFFEVFELSKFSKNTYVVIHSDHGEGFGEHGYQYHGQNLFNDQVHVPLLVFGPQLPSQVVQTPVSLIDVMPTLLELAQVSALPPKPRGSSLLKFAYQPNADHHPVMIEMLKDSTHSSRRSIVDWPWKLHYSRDYNRFMFFNLRKDPFETVDMASDRSPAFQRVRRRLMRFLSEETTPLKPRNR